MRTAERVARLEERLRPLPAGEAELCGLVKFLYFDELCAGQAVLERHGDAAFSDPTMVALVAVARLRRQGVAVAPLFSEAA